MAKYRVPVSIETVASHVIGVVECDTMKEFQEKAEALWEEQEYEYPTTNISNDFDLGEWEISECTRSDLEHFKV